jgi:hypothetical protein
LTALKSRSLKRVDGVNNQRMERDMKTQQHESATGLFVAKGLAFGKVLTGHGASHRAAYADFVKQAAQVEASLPPMLRRQAQ